MARRTYVTLDRLASMPVEKLKSEWARRYAAPAPNLSADMLRLRIAYKLQVQKLGGLSRSTRSLLRQVEARGSGGDSRKPLPRKLTPGTRLVRDWHGVGHTVTDLDDWLEYDGKRWKSLTAIARAITGTHWNGPRFFGLSGVAS